MQWLVEKMHDHCKLCAECAGNAIQHANRTEATKSVSSYAENSTANKILHSATVILKGSISDERRQG